MPGYILTTSSQVMCTHGGKAVLSTSNTKVKIERMPALLESDVHAVAGCSFTLPGPKPSPCVRIEWSAGAALCKNDGTKVLVQSSVGRCISAEGATQGLAMITQTQTKVRGT
ncbi:hypothetical protein HLB44_32560 [Aquincola sp. S2]|uniref:DUF4280 domain-containing protein n=1 Tax=Pseudaquabacterium terrae TaxID=2732868 RepID=A0ABX2ESU3_9BURK|nr:hypothetical protein [Aquabacterium terrae]NRF71731.1 hypothetical protein [Aquabacterium terrae]